MYSVGRSILFAVILPLGGMTSCPVEKRSHYVDLYRAAATLRMDVSEVQAKLFNALTSFCEAHGLVSTYEGSRPLMWYENTDTGIGLVFVQVYLPERGGSLAEILVGGASGRSPSEAALKVEHGLYLLLVETFGPDAVTRE